MNRLTRLGLTTAAVLAAFATGAMASPTITDWDDKDEIADAHVASVYWADQNRIVEGHEDGTFRPAQPVSRQQFASLLHRYHSASTTPTEGSTASVAAGEITTVESRCPATMLAVAGGYDISEPPTATQAARISVLGSQSVERQTEDGPHSAWEVRLANGSTSEVTIQVSALCTVR